MTSWGLGPWMLFLLLYLGMDNYKISRLLEGIFDSREHLLLCELVRPVDASRHGSKRVRRVMTLSMAVRPLRQIIMFV